MENCLFCRIVAGEIPATKVYEDELVLAFRDIDPKAPAHILIVPKTHHDNMAAAVGDGALVAKLFEAACGIAVSESIADGGYRLVVNSGADGGQSVDHLHVHLLGGRQLIWPPG